MPGPAAAGPRTAAAHINKLLLHRAIRPAVFLLALLPWLLLAWGAYSNNLGANPAEAVIRRSGDWTLRLLCLTLAVTPVRVMTGWHALARLRRMLGLFTFFYGCWHFLAYAWLDMGLELTDIINDIPKRPFILVGTAAMLLMLPLAATSFNAAIKALGAARWQALHRLVYAIAVLALLHFLWMRAGKNLYGEWALYATTVALLLGWRVRRWWRGRAAQALRP